MTAAERPGLLGRAAGAFTGKVVETIPPEVILQHLDLDALLDHVDVNHLLDRIDINPLLDRIDVNRLLDRIDVNRLLDGLDLEKLLETVDMEGLVRRSGVPDIVAESTSRMAGGALDLARRQVVGLDTVIARGIAVILRRPRDGLPSAPVSLTSDAGTEDRRTVTGDYAGPLSRVLAIGVDGGLIFLLFTLGVAGFNLLSNLFVGRTFQGDRSSLLAAGIFVLWAFLYLFVTLAVAGRTPGKGLVGLRVVAADGSAVTPTAAFIRTLGYPLSALFLGLGFLPILLAHDKRALHDRLARTAVVYDWGDRPAQLSAPLSAFLARQ